MFPSETVIPFETTKTHARRRGKSNRCAIVSRIMRDVIVRSSGYTIARQATLVASRRPAFQIDPVTEKYPMSEFHQFVSTLLADRKIDDAEVRQIRERLHHDGQLDLEDVKLLVELYCQADEYSPAFADLFFSVLEEVILEDGQIQPSEQFYLLKMVYSDRVIHDREKEFLLKLKETATNISPDFEALCDTALTAPAANWDTGGR